MWDADLISWPVQRTGHDGYTSLYYMVGKMGQNRTGEMKLFSGKQNVGDCPTLIYHIMAVVVSI